MRARFSFSSMLDSMTRVLPLPPGGEGSGRAVPGGFGAGDVQGMSPGDPDHRGIYRDIYRDRCGGKGMACRVLPLEATRGRKRPGRKPLLHHADCPSALVCGVWGRALRVSLGSSSTRRDDKRRVLYLLQLTLQPEYGHPRSSLMVQRISARMEDVDCPFRNRQESHAPGAERRGAVGSLSTRHEP